MSWNLYAAVLTPLAPAANNRGETEGNTTTLQKLVWRGSVHTCVSAEAIRFALRRGFQDQGLPVNRTWNEAAGENEWKDPRFGAGPGAYADDDLFGYMLADKQGEAATKRRSPAEFTKAVSLLPWSGDVSFAVASIGATPSAATKGKNPVPFSAEVHATRYQYNLALTPAVLADPSRAEALINGIVGLRTVAGNHARYLYDFAPDAILLRWTQDPAPRMLYPFMPAGDGAGTPDLVRRIEAGDIDPAEVIAGGDPALLGDGVLKAVGVTTLPGVKQAAAEAIRRMTSHG